LTRKNKKTNQTIPKRLPLPQQQKLDGIRISKPIIKYTIGTLFLFMLLGVPLFIHYQNTVSMAREEKVELECLRQNNHQQLEQIEQLSKDTASLQSNMERLNALDAEIRHIVNNEDTTATSRAGLLRPSLDSYHHDTPQVQIAIKDISDAVNQLQVAVKVREESLIELRQELLNKQMKLAARPSIWPATGEVTSRFGWRNSPSGRSTSDFHPGIDIANSIGTPIVATADGIIVHSQWDDGGYGNMVEINHGNGIVTVYGHNSEIVVQEGQVVKKGQLIAYLGDTGYSTGPHVHYEIRVNGTAVDPSRFLN